MARLLAAATFAALLGARPAVAKPSSPGRPVTELLGCYDDIADGTRDLPDFVGNGSVQRCAKLCKGYKYFGHQSFNECWCGNSYGKFGKTTGCNCDDSDDVGAGTNCVYKICADKKEKERPSTTGTKRAQGGARTRKVRAGGAGPTSASTSSGREPEVLV
mmetsp:Transcript_73040/g.143226  ORF Transcript_73040/g.143226 Transcript_73040/m.143226 type:complete len:160 (-) Transcript_73040:105-584(-)